MNRRHASGMTGIDGAQKGKGLGSPDFADEQAIGPHPQRRFEERLDRDLRRALIATRSQQMHGVLLRWKQLARVLERK